MADTCLPLKGLGNLREEVALSGIADVLTWLRALEPSLDPDYLRPGRRVGIYLKFLDKLDAILESGNIGIDPEQSRWPAYEAILTQSISGPIGSRAILLPEDYPRISQWPILEAKAEEWMEDAKRVSVAGSRQVLEDGRDVCNSESDAEYSRRGEVLGEEGTPDMYHKKVEFVLSRAILTTGQASGAGKQPQGPDQVNVLLLFIEVVPRRLEVTGHPRNC
jgi:hypothetical protein